jgi:hypothetical protein
MLGDRFFRGSDCDSVHYYIAENIRERLAVSKRAVKKIDTGRSNFKF